MDKFKKALIKVLSIIGLATGAIFLIAGPDVLLAINEMMKKPEDKTLRLVTILVIISLFIIFLTIATIYEFKKSSKK